MVATGARMGLRTTALLTDMNQPNGRLAGNAVEVDEAIACLSGRGPEDLQRLTLALAAEILLLKNLASSPQQAEAILQDHLCSGRAREKFDEMVAAQGGDLKAPRRRAPESVVSAPRSGFARTIDTEVLELPLAVGQARGHNPVSQAAVAKSCSSTDRRCFMGRTLFCSLAGAGVGFLLGCVAVCVFVVFGPGPGRDTGPFILFVGVFLAGTGAIAGAIIGGVADLREFLSRKDQTAGKAQDRDKP